MLEDCLCLGEVDKARLGEQTMKISSTLYGQILDTKLKDQNATVLEVFIKMSVVIG